MKTILVTGATGYKGTVLVPKLLAQGYKVIAFDTQWFGNHLQPHDNLTVIKGDVRFVETVPLEGVDAIVHLASIANDPCGDLDPKLTWEVSALATMQLADHAVRKGVKHFVYASSGSVYGVKEEQNVTEDLSLEPLSEYNKTKMVSERVLLSYSDKMVVQIVRPATVCGLSPRMRLDVAVNMLTMQAIKNGKITVFGGDQSRPNIHMDDITDLYVFLLERPDVTGVYNAGFENITIAEIAEILARRTGAEVITTPSNDPRSYRVNSDKLLATGFRPKKSVEIAIEELIEAYQKGLLADKEEYYNLKWMQKTVL
ncbi:SDR family oxidoreductase [Catenovulum sp. 2E275]|uniref:NAD-dependent epimerase/dehydratase family protein n=1 Tax=Catenovulum sp. 2E275 TaxID=2980497 RepID=UPI0021D27226|nr:SDR family oxidoreductase [Catenovulum sp. 2E275]MCU4674739.1 SDR family oxidoreductase [Catenovulum sp. 2E275]